MHRVHMEWDSPSPPYSNNSRQSGLKARNDDIFRTQDDPQQFAHSKSITSTSTPSVIPTGPSMSAEIPVTDPAAPGVPIGSESAITTVPTPSVDDVAAPAVAPVPDPTAGMSQSDLRKRLESVKKELRTALDKKKRVDRDLVRLSSHSQ